MLQAKLVHQMLTGYARHSHLNRVYITMSISSGMERLEFFSHRLIEEQRLEGRKRLYTSAFFERRKKDYMDLLLRVSTQGAWEYWIRFCLQGVTYSLPVKASCSKEFFKSSRAASFCM